MKKTILTFAIVVFVFAFSCMIPTKVQAQLYHAQQVPEENLEDAILVLLLPKIEDEVEKYYGESRLIDCWEILDLKRLVDPESFFFEVTVRLVTFGEGRQPPHDLVTMIFNNYPIEWQVQDITVENIAPEDIDTYCD